MAFCTKCGNKLTEGAQFCTACGQPVGAPPASPQPAPAPKRRPALVLIVPVVIVGLIVLGAGGWAAFSLLTGGPQSGRAPAQVEAVASLIEGFSEGDVAQVTSALPSELHDAVEVALSEDTFVRGTVERQWDGDVLVLTLVTEDEAEPQTIRISADGGRDVGVVTLTEDGPDGTTSEAKVTREGGRWVVTEVEGAPVAEAFGLDLETEASYDEGEDSSDDSTFDNGGSVGVGADESWESQSEIETAASNYYFAESENEYTDVSGTVDEYNWLVTDGWLDGAPTCPYDGEYYYLFDDGTTGCPSGVHGYYLDEE